MDRVGNVSKLKKDKKLFFPLIFMFLFSRSIIKLLGLQKKFNQRNNPTADKYVYDLKKTQSLKVMMFCKLELFENHHQLVTDVTFLQGHDINFPFR